MFSTKNTDSDRYIQQIQLVNQTYAELLEIDKKLAIPATIAIYFWIRSNVGFIELAIALGVSVYSLSSVFKDRNDAAVKFKNALKALADSYDKLNIYNGLEITHDEIYLQMLQTLAPFIAKTEDLLPRTFREENVEKLSPKFISILAQSPHQLSFLNHLNQQRYAPGFFSRVTSYFATAPSQPTVTIQATPVHQDLLARAKLNLYGFKSMMDMYQPEGASLKESALKLLI